MSAGSGLTACSNIQARLNQIWDSNNAGTYREETPYLSFLLSPSNRNGLQQVINGKGKKRTAEVIYFPRVLESAVDSDQSRTCTASDTIDDCSATYTIDTTVNEQINFTFSYGDLVTYCQDNEMFYAEQVQRHLDALVRKVASKSAAQAAPLIAAGEWNTHVGNIQDSSVNAGRTLFTTRTRLAASGADGYSEYPYTFNNIQLAADMSNFGATGLFGGLDLSQALDQRKKGGGMSDAGMDVGAMVEGTGLGAFYDKWVTAELGDHAQSWAVGLGAMQLLQFNMYDNSFNSRNDDTVKLGVIQDPRTGLMVDISFKIDCETVHTVLTATTKVVGLPTDMYQAGDDLSGVVRASTVAVDNS